MAFIRKTYKITIIFVIAFFLKINTSFAVDDGFGAAKKIEGKYFTVYYSPQLEIPKLLQQLNISPSDNLLVGRPLDQGLGLADMLDVLFLRACDILDMHLYSFHGTVKIGKDSIQLNNIYNYLFRKNVAPRSFYVYDLNTIYTSADNFTRAIIGHEIGHAVISHYFVVQPSVKIQEVLAMYVEYQLKRSGQGN